MNIPTLKYIGTYLRIKVSLTQILANVSEGSVRFIEALLKRY